MSPEEAFELIGQYVDVPPYVVVEGEEVEWDRFPAVVKVLTFEHKSERGWVKRVEDREGLRRAIRQLLPYGKVIVQEEVKGVELVLSGRVDPYFGPIVLLGIGGFFVEVYRDYAVRLAPLEAADVVDMVDELRGRRLLEGYRGIRPNLDALIKAVVSFSHFVDRYRPELAEINPLIVGDRAYAVDVRLRCKSHA